MEFLFAALNKYIISEGCYICLDPQQYFFVNSTPCLFPTRKPADTPSGDRRDSTQDAAIAAMPSSAEVTLPVSEVIHSEPEVKQKVTAPSEVRIFIVILLPRI